MTCRFGRQRRLYAALAIAAACVSSVCHGDTVSWNGTGTSWDDGSSWSGNAKPLTTDTAAFNLAGVSANQKVCLYGPQTIAGLVFNANATGGVFFVGGAGIGRTLTIGTSGIKVESGAGEVTLSTGTDGAVNVLLNGSQTWSNDSNALLTVGGSITHNIANTDLTLTLGGTGTGGIALSGAISNKSSSDTSAITKTGTNVLALSGSNTYTGATTVKNGTLGVSNIAVGMNLGSATSAVILGDTSSKGTLSYSGNSVNFTRGLTIKAGGGEFDVTNASTTVTFTTGGVDSSGVFTIGGAGNVTFSANSLISGSGSLVMNGTGVLITGTGHTYTGTTQINRGTLSTNLISTGTRSGLGDASSIVTLGDAANKGTLLYTGTTASFSRGFLINDGGGELDVTTSGQTLTVATRNITGTGLLTVGGAGNTHIYSSAIATTGGLTKIGTGTLTLSSASNSYSGDTTISQGVLKLGAHNVLPNGTDKGNVIVNGTLDMAARSDTINGLSGNGIVDSSASGALILTVGDNDATSTYAGSIRNTIGILGVTKTGSGSLTLSGNNSYSGPTTVSGGTLLVNGTLSSSGTVIVTNATLGGTGTVGSVTLNDNAILNPATPGSVGMLTLESLTLAGGTVQLDLDGDANTIDQIHLNGTASGTGILQVNLVGLTQPTLGTHYTLFTGDIPSDVEFTVFLPSGDGYEWNSDELFLIGGGYIYATASIPEPGPLMLGLAGLGPLVWGARGLWRKKRPQRASAA